MTGRVVITGADVLSPLGATWAAHSDALQAGRSAVAAIRCVDAASTPVGIAAEVTAWQPDQPGELTRAEAMLERTSRAALEQAALDPDRARIGVAVGVGQRRLPRVTGADARAIRQLVHQQHGAAVNLAERFGCRGPAYTCFTACASATDAIGLGMQLVRRGAVDAMLCGGVDSQITGESLSELFALSVLAVPDNDGDRHPKPFDRQRRGFVLGEGAAMFVIESRAHARARHAAVRGALVGYGSAMDTYSVAAAHPNGDGAARAMRAALADASLGPDDVDYVNAHGTATRVNDAAETTALKRVFGTHAARLPISATKAMTGHLLAASGALELAISLIALDEQFIPPTVNYREPDPSCDLDYVPNEARAATLTTVMSNSFGFGGQNASLIVTLP